MGSSKAFPIFSSSFFAASYPDPVGDVEIHRGGDDIPPHDTLPFQPVLDLEHDIVVEPGGICAFGFRAYRVPLDIASKDRNLFYPRHPPYTGCLVLFSQKTPVSGRAAR